MSDSAITKEDFESGEGVTEKIKEAILSGNNKTEEIQDYIGESYDSTTSYLRLLEEVGFVSYDGEYYQISDDSMDVEPANGEFTEVPVQRNYDFSERIPSDVPEFYQTNDELDEIKADLEVNTQIAEDKGVEKARLPRYWLTGPSGVGKTHLARKIAQDQEAALFTIQGRYSMNEADLLGSPLLINGETVWVDGPLTKALIASQEMKVVLLIDEANRARPESKSVLFSVLDDRCSVELDALGGETITGNPMNLITCATINEGKGYQTQKLDLAEKRRFGLQFEMNHLGLRDKQKEVQLVSERSMVSETVSEFLVSIANSLRKEAGDDGSPVGVIQRGVPTAMVISWARTAYTFDKKGIENPILKSMEASIIRPFYGDDNTQWVRDEVADRLSGAPVDEDEFVNWLDKDMDSFVDAIMNDEEQ